MSGECGLSGSHSSDFFTFPVYACSFMGATRVGAVAVFVTLVPWREFGRNCLCGVFPSFDELSRYPGGVCVCGEITLADSKSHDAAVCPNDATE